MNLLAHLSIHFALSVIAGFIAWKLWKQPLVSFFGAIMGGVLVDMDHFIDYFLELGFNFNLNYFIQGYQFLQSGKIYILFHGWEYVIILLVAAYLAKKRLILKSVLFAAAVGLFFHLSFDLYVNDGVMIKTYSVVYRLTNNFDNTMLVTWQHYQTFLLERKAAPFLNYSK